MEVPPTMTKGAISFLHSIYHGPT